jgi:hypothetical protein
MKWRVITATLISAAVVAGAVVPGRAGEVVSIALQGRYFAEPATVRFVVTIEPDDENRTLRVEADSQEMFRASELPLQGAKEKRLHTITFSNLAAGNYTLRAQVLSATDLRAVATDEVVVAGVGRQ